MGSGRQMDHRTDSSEGATDGEAIREVFDSDPLGPGRSYGVGPPNQSTDGASRRKPGVEHVLTEEAGPPGY
jgi:hypothetical protein